MTLKPRDTRALALLAVSVVLGFVYRVWPASSGPVVAAAADSTERAETRLAKLRDTAATVPSKEAILKTVSAELAAREKGLLIADTAPQAQAQLIQMVRRLGTLESPPVEIRATELGPVRALGDSYGEAVVSVQIECRIDQLVNLLAGLAAQSELVSTSDLRVIAANPREKTVSVRITVSGVVPRKLVPEKKGGAAF